MTPEQRDTPRDHSQPGLFDREPIDTRAGQLVHVTRHDVPSHAECYLEISDSDDVTRVLLTREHANALAERLTIPF